MLRASFSRRFRFEILFLLTGSVMWACILGMNLVSVLARRTVSAPAESQCAGLQNTQNNRLAPRVDKDSDLERACPFLSFGESTDP